MFLCRLFNNEERYLLLWSCSPRNFNRTKCKWEKSPRDRTGPYFLGYALPYQRERDFVCHGCSHQRPIYCKSSTSSYFPRSQMHLSRFQIKTRRKPGGTRIRAASGFGELGKYQKWNPAESLVAWWTVV